MRARTKNIIIGSIAAASVATIAVLTSGTSKRNYYFSNDGNDGNAGTITSPYKSIAKANTLTNADTIFFKSGDEFFGTLVPNTAGEVITSYGEGRAKITGFKKITDWNNLGNNLYESSTPVTSLSYINLVTINGKVAHKGTYPDRDAPWGGYLKITSHSGKTSITDNTLPPGFEIPSGSELVVRDKQWVIDRCRVTGRSGNTINYTGVTYEPENGMGYFFQNAVKFCNRNDEWYFNPGTKKLIVYSDSGEPQNVKVASIQNLLHTNGKTNLKVENIDFEGSNDNTVIVASSTGFSMDNFSITYAGNHGILTNSASHNLRLTNFIIQWCLNMAIETNINNIYIENFKVFDTYPLVGHGENGDGSRGTAIAFRHLDSNAVLKNGEISRSGNCAFSFKNEETSTHCNNVLVDQVWADSSDLLKSDQGALYTHVGSTSHPRYYNRVIKNSKITNTIGNNAGTLKTFKSGFGFYGDVGTTDLTLINDTITTANRAGIIMNYGAERWLIQNCVIYGNGIGMGTDSRGTQIFIQETDARPVRNNVIKDNEIYSDTNRKLIYADNSFGYNKANPGTIDNNHYSCLSLYASSTFITRNKPEGTKKRSFASWQSLGFDSHSDIILK